MLSVWMLSLQQSGKAAPNSACLTAGLQAAMSAQTGSDYDDDYADEISASQAGRVSAAGTVASTAAQLANSKAQQSLAASGFDDDALLEDDSLGGVQGSGSSTGQISSAWSVPLFQASCLCPQQAVS